MTLRQRWKRLDYLTHRWIGIVLGVMVFVWFGSGIVLMYHPYPELTESRQLALLRGFEPGGGAQPIGFRAAVRAYTAHAEPDAPAIAGGRLALWDQRLVYSLWRDDGRRMAAAGLVDASNGAVLTPISGETAARVARAVVGPIPSLERVERLPRGDHYFMGNEHRGAFPVFRVRFADARATAVYVSERSGATVAAVTRATRVTTWLGTVPHWLYFMWLYYDHAGAWTWINLILPGVAVLLGLTGVVYGVSQLWPRRQGAQRISPYHGASLWHHVSGVVFGLLVLTWALSGVLELLGPGSDPRKGDAERVRGGAARWDAIRVSEAAALERVRSFVARPVIPRSIDLVQLNGRPGYVISTLDGPVTWVDAESGAPRGDLPEEVIRGAALRVMGPVTHAVSWRRISAYDSYYYARHGRERALPAWRVSFDDPQGSVLYLDAVTGIPLGFVDADVRAWRWWREALHDWDWPALNNKRPWWDLVVLPLLLGGAVTACTGVWLLLRRVKRMTVS